MGRLAEALLVTGRPAEALERGREALAHARGQRERGHEAWALALVAEIHARQPAPEVARGGAALSGALALARSLGMQPLERRCTDGLSRLTAA